MPLRSGEAVNKRDELLAELWQAAGPLRRLVGRKRFDAILEAAIATAPIQELWHRQNVGEPTSREPAMRDEWAGKIAKRREVQFGPLAWLIVGSIINFIISKLLEWAVRSHTNAVLLSGWNAEYGRRS